MDLLSPHFGVFFWQFITIFLVLLILKLFAFGPITKSLEARKKSLEESLSNAKEVENKLMRDHLNGYMKECNQNMNQTFDILSKIAGGSLNATKKEQWKTKKSELTGKYESSFIGET